MGKSKKRIIQKGRYLQFENLTREEAIEEVVNSFKSEQPRMDLITLFGLSGEELLENGAEYEDIVSLGEILK